MLDKDFCTYLEYKISEALSNSTDKAIKHLWCDGILLPTSDTDILQKSVNDKREIVMTAFVGLDGQDRYILKVKFGSKSLSKYSRGLDIKECIPDVTKKDWYNIDTTKKILTIQLL